MNDRKQNQLRLRILIDRVGRRHARVLAFIMLGMFVAAGAAIAAASEGRSRASRPVASKLAAVRAHTHPTPAHYVDLSALSSPAQASDVLPTADANTLTTDFSFTDPDVGGARQVTESNGQIGYLVPTGSGACAINSVDVVCSPSPSNIAGTAEADFCSPYIPAGNTQVIWLMPDGVSGVTLQLSDGSTQSEPSGYNIYVADIPQANNVSPTSISWQQNGQTQTADLPAAPPVTGNCVNSNGAVSVPTATTPAPDTSGTSTVMTLTDTTTIP